MIWVPLQQNFQIIKLREIEKDKEDLTFPLIKRTNAMENLFLTAIDLPGIYL